MRLIDADALRAKMLANADTYCNDDVRHGYHNCELLVDDAPTIEPERKKGRWKQDAYVGIYCSECLYVPLKDVVITKFADGTEERCGNFNLTPYCPNCGSYNGGEQK